MYYYLYKVTNIINNKIYIGVHKTKNIDDGYRGSGKRLLQAYTSYGIDNFTYEILEYFNTEEAMYLRELEIVNEDFIKRPDVYNLKIGGEGGWYTNEDIIKRRSSKNRGTKRTSEQREKYSRCKLGTKNPCFGKEYSIEERKKQSLIMKVKARRGKDHPCFGKIKTEEEKINLSEKNKAAFANRKKIVCDHCKKEVLPNHYAQYHGERCKINVTV